MTKDIPRPSPAEEKAAYFYGRINSTVIDNRDIREWEEWLKDAENRRAYERLSQFLAGAEALGDDPQLNAIADQAIARGRKSAARPSGGGSKARWGGGLVLAAAVILSVAIFAAPRGERYRSAVGERKVVSLADGSQVVLNTNSELRVRLEKQQRRIELVRGQALFDVAHDATRPFIVRAGDTQVRAIGTRFDVYRRADDVRVTLSQGRVEVREDSRAADAWTLSPGEQLIVSKKAPNLRPVAADVGAATSWTTGQLTFHAVPLSDAVAEVNRYSRRKVVLAANAPRDQLVFGNFPTGDVEAFVIGTSDMLGLERHERENGRTIELSARGAASP